MESKKPDLRDKAKDKVAVTDTHAQMAGKQDKGSEPIVPRSDMHMVTPDIGKGLAEGQVTKSS